MMQRPQCTKLQIYYLLYYAKREIILKWKVPSPPSVASWEKVINDVLPMYKLTSICRNYPGKLDRVWQMWTAQ